jgi:hypothetical protein
MSSKEQRIRELNNADTLAKFANLEPSTLDSFRKSYPDFFPLSFWTVRNGGPISIQPYPPSKADQTFYPFTMAYVVHGAVQDMWQKKFPRESTILLIGLGNGAALREELDLQAYPYQSAAMLLHIESWRVKICEECRSRFVADHAKRKYCSDGCSQSAIQKSHNKWWNDVGKRQRSKKRGK